MKIESGLLTSGGEVLPAMQNDASKVKDAAAQFEQFQLPAERRPVRASNDRAHFVLERANSNFAQHHGNGWYRATQLVHVAGWCAAR